MRELQVVAVSEDGRHVVLGTRKGDEARAEFTVLMDDRLKAAIRGDLPRLGEQAAPQSTVTPKDIQARLRAGESVEQIAASAGVPAARVERFAGPVLSERERMIAGTRSALLTRPRRGVSALPLGDAVAEHLQDMAGYKPDSTLWTARREESGRWLVQVSFVSRAKRRTAGWRYDPSTKQVDPVDSWSVAMAHVDAPEFRLEAARAGASGRARKPAAPRGRSIAATPSGLSPAAPPPRPAPVARPRARTQPAPGRPAAARPAAARTATARPAVRPTAAGRPTVAAPRPAAAAAVVKAARPATSRPSVTAASAGVAKAARPAASRPAGAVAAPPAAAATGALAGARKGAVPTRPAAPSVAVRPEDALDVASAPPVTATTAQAPAASTKRPARSAAVEPVEPVEPVAPDVAAPAGSGSAVGLEDPAAEAPAADTPAPEASAPSGPPTLRVVPSPEHENSGTDPDTDSDTGRAASTQRADVPQAPARPAARRAAGGRASVPGWADVLLGTAPVRPPSGGPERPGD